MNLYSEQTENPLFRAMDSAQGLNESKEAEEAEEKRTVGWNGAPAALLDENDVKEAVLALYAKLTRGANLDFSYFDKFSDHDIGLFAVLMFQTRDVLNGKGEKDLFYQLFDYFAGRCPETAKMLLYLVPEHGYWKDLNKMYKRWTGLNGVFPELRQQIVHMYVGQLKKDYVEARKFLNGRDEERKEEKKEHKLGKMSLAYKWAPRLKSNDHFLALALANALPPYLLKTLGGRGKAMVERAYRKLLKTCSDACPTVEHLLCGVGDGRVTEAEVMERFENCGWVPSVALTRLRKALRGVKKNGEERDNLSDIRRLVADLFNKHIEKVKEGKEGAKVNAKACQPTDLMKFFKKCEYDAVMEAQLTALLASLTGNQVDEEKGEVRVDLGRCVALSDMSYSMTCNAGTSGLTCMDVSMFLGLLVAKLANKNWRDRVLTFEENPEWVNFDDCKTFADAFQRLKNASWGGSTNFEKALDQILSHAIALRLSRDEMPLIFFVFSDMQFNQASNQQRWETVHESMARKWLIYGYTLPLMVYWNLNGNTPGFAVDANTPNTVMASGFSPAMLKLFMSGGDLMSFQNPTPIDLMMTDLLSKHYEDVRQVVVNSPELTTPSYFTEDPEAADKQDEQYVEPNEQPVGPGM